jgi:hypothetical protein
MVIDTRRTQQPFEETEEKQSQASAPRLQWPNWSEIVHFVGTVIIWVTVVTWLFPRLFYVGISSGLDPSWKLSLHMAYSQGLIWGRDFVFTYGPLGFLSSRLALPEFRIWYVAIDLFFFANIVYLGWIAVWRLTRWSERLGALAVVYCAGSSINLVDLAIVLFIIQLMHLFLHQSSRRSWHLAPAIICAVLTFFIKLNTGLITVPLLILYCLWQSFYRDSRIAALSAMLLTVGVILCASLVLPVSLIPYVKYSMAIASGYNDSMTIFIEGRSQFMTMALVLLGLVALCALSQTFIILRSLTTIFQIGSVGLLLFLLFKQGFVRADGHDAAFFNYVPVVLSILYVAVQLPLRSALSVAVTVSLAFGFAYQRDSFLVSNVTDDLRGVSQYFEQASASDEEWLKQAASGPDDHLPPEWHARIGKSTVDVIPWDISTVFFNRFNYNPRPVMQSYSAYQPELDQLNADKYASATKPDFVLFRLICIDGRYCFGDEGKTQRSLYLHYRPVTAYGHFLLLKKRKNSYIGQSTEVQSGVAQIDEWIPVPESTDGFTYFNATLSYSSFGKLRSVLYRPDGLRYEVRFQTQGERAFRTYRGALAAGVLASHFVDNLDDVAKYINNNGEGLLRIVAVRVVSTANYPGVERSFPYSFTSVSRSRDEEGIEAEELAPVRAIPDVTPSATAG